MTTIPPKATSSSAVVTEEEKELKTCNDCYNDATKSNNENTDHDIPSLFQEALTSAASASFVFAIADLRKVARKGKLFSKSDSDLLMNLPLKFSVLRDILDRNKSIVLKDKVLRSDEFDVVYNIILKKIIDERLFDFFNRKQINFYGGECYTVGDSNPYQECVYAISKSSANIKRINLSFRGSITIQDWMKDSKLLMGEIQNPLLHSSDSNSKTICTATAKISNVDTKSKEGSHQVQVQPQHQPETLRVHLGFRDYLYGNSASPLRQKIADKGKKILSSRQKNKSTSVGGESAVEEKSEGRGKKNKIETIIEEVISLLNQYPDYTLHISGHSLGGALAVLASLELAPVVAELQQRKQIKQHPVTCITIGNPKVGNDQFCRAIQTLEREKRLRILTIHNKYDLVPMLPDPLWSCYLCSYSERSFHHAGMIMKLDPKTNTYHTYHRKTSEMQIGKRIRSKLELYLVVLRGMHHIKKRHFYGTYLNNLISQEDELSKLNTNDLYNEQLK